MRYYYLHPFKAQYFFPEGFRDYDLFLNFFKAYTWKGAASWWLFNHIPFYRMCFRINSIESSIPENEIRSMANTRAIMAFNIGTPGARQKINALGTGSGAPFFLKFAQNPQARKDVRNEYNILAALAEYDFSPSVKDFCESDQKVLLKTDILRGTRVGHINMNEQLFQLLLSFAEMKFDTSRSVTFSKSSKSVFSHGDFGPWNMMEKPNQKLLLYDWETAGQYPLGYDLFTFIFQSNFILKSRPTVRQIITENQPWITKYFHYFGVSEWEKYLEEFSEIKINQEAELRPNVSQKYQRLKKYVQKSFEYGL
jgi:hypothetical protein